MRAGLRAGRRALSGERPARYGDDWFGPFLSRALPIASRPCAAVLDVGSGRSPTIVAAQRGAAGRYVGLDLSSEELALAPPDAYDAVVVGDAAVAHPELMDAFDLIVSFYVFEHIRSLDVALEHMRSYLRPGGRLVALFSGTYSVFGLINRMLPDAVGARLVATVRHRPRETVFPAYYDHCYGRALDRLLRPWADTEVLPIWRGADYFAFARPLEAAYVAYEEWAMRAGRWDLAPHYLIAATR